MYYNEANRITFILDNYSSEEEMFNDVANTLRILTKNDEICTFEYEDCGVYVLQHNYADISFGTSYPLWVTSEEAEQVYLFREADDRGEHEPKEDA